MHYSKLIFLGLFASVGFATGQETKMDEWESKYEKLLLSDPAVRQKVEDGYATKKEIIQWLKSKGSHENKSQKQDDIDWEQKYKQFLESDPGARRKLQNGDTSKAEIIAYLKENEASGRKKSRPNASSEKGGCDNSSEKGFRKLVENSQQREYLLHVPSSYDRKRPHPLVINFHGFGDCASDYAENIGEVLGFNSTAKENNFLVVYPQAAFREKGARYWEPAGNSTDNTLTNDVHFTKQLIADIDKSYNVDLNRVYAVGYSNGGMMAYDLACVDEKFIAAIGVMSGTMLGKPGADVKSLTPIIHLHGAQDQVLPYGGNEHYQSVPDLVDSWRKHHGIPKANLQRKILNDGRATFDSYRTPDGKSAVALYTIKREHGKPGGHVWFSDNLDGVHPNQVLWNFLSKYHLDD
ncbi:MAG: PHB depolymerase family esterase [Planctomycetota bacterium]|nr:PHB depolymerase family esterase [Planctomycetota bacterium]